MIKLFDPRSQFFLSYSYDFLGFEAYAYSYVPILDRFVGNLFSHITRFHCINILELLCYVAWKFEVFLKHFIL